MGHGRLTRFEFEVIAAILCAGEDAYGVRIADEITSRTGREVSIGSLYRTLKRLEDRGLLSCYMGEATAERGGRAKTYYRVEGPGREALRETTRQIRSLLDGLALETRSG